MTWESPSTVRIALLDDHAVVRYGMARRLSEEPDFLVIGTFGSSREMMAALRGAPVDVLLIDYALGANDVDGLNLIRVLRVRFPQSRILVSSSHYNPATIALAMKAGAHGFVGKTEELSELVRAIRSVVVGRLYLNSLMAAQLWGAFDADVASPPATARALPLSLVEDARLSPREREVLRCCLDGMSVTQIAQKFARSIKTISGQKQSAFRKLGVRHDNELFKIQRQIEDV